MIRQIVTSLSVVRHRRAVTATLRVRHTDRYTPVGMILGKLLTRRIHKIDCRAPTTSVDAAHFAPPTENRSE